MTNQYLPDFPKTFRSAKLQLELFIAENDELEDKEFEEYHKGMNCGIRVALGILKDLERNMRAAGQIQD